MYVCVCVCLCELARLVSTHGSLTQNVRSSSSVSHGAPCPSKAYGDRNKVVLESEPCSFSTYKQQGGVWELVLSS